MKTTERKYIDCRDFPGSNCSLKLSGTEEEVVKAAVLHGVSVHQYKDTPEFREQLKQTLKDEKMSEIGGAKVA